MTPRPFSAVRFCPLVSIKAAGLALMLELLTAALAGGAFGNEIEASDRSGIDPDSSKLFIALNPEAFGGREVLAGRVGRLSCLSGCCRGRDRPVHLAGSSVAGRPGR